MTTLYVTVSQHRVANPFGREAVEYFLIKDSNDCVYIVPSDEANEWSSEYGYHVVAKVNVDRPLVMVGNIEDIEAEIISIIREEAIQEEICITNMAGTLFVK